MSGVGPPGSTRDRRPSRRPPPSRPGSRSKSLPNSTNLARCPCANLLASASTGAPDRKDDPEAVHESDQAPGQRDVCGSAWKKPSTRIILSTASAPRAKGARCGWPYDYYYPFWSYGTAYHYDYGPYVPAHSNYGYSDLSNVYGYTRTTGDSRNDTHVNQIPPEVTQSCGGFAPGVTSFPIDRIRQAIHPTGEQVTFLDDLATASSKASALLNASCPNQPPLTPLARLDAVETRLDATIRAIESVRPALATSVRTY